MVSFKNLPLIIYRLLLIVCQAVADGVDKLSCFVAAVFPIHYAENAFFLDIFAFFGNALFIFISDEIGAVEEPGRFCGVVPITGPAVFVDIIIVKIRKAGAVEVKDLRTLMKAVIFIFNAVETS